jgi:alanine dehydrogenase
MTTVGVPKEIKTREYRVGLVPAGAGAFVGSGHTVFIEQGAIIIPWAGTDPLAIGAVISFSSQ